MPSSTSIEAEYFGSPIPSSTAKSMSSLAALAPDETPSESSGSSGHCGPDITDWFVNALNKVVNHKIVQDAKDQWNSGIDKIRMEALFTFAMLVKKDGPLDLKKPLRKIKTEHCPSFDCLSTVTICDKCYDVDVTGNIMYGVVGQTIGIPDEVLHKGAAIAQAIDNGTWPPEDEPKDTHAINVGFCIKSNADGAEFTRAILCQCISEAQSLNTKPSCSPCDEKWSGGE